MQPLADELDADTIPILIDESESFLNVVGLVRM
ncbi:hypothetical protein CD31A_2229 [Corynebacterium diphtheriae 31A]|nr:hypothetical protein CD31A_2229 [Corynebacterium diphtheriae 31A]